MNKHCFEIKGSIFTSKEDLLIFASYYVTEYSFSIRSSVLTSYFASEERARLGQRVRANFLFFNSTGSQMPLVPEECSIGKEGEAAHNGRRSKISVTLEGIKCGDGLLGFMLVSSSSKAK